MKICFVNDDFLIGGVQKAISEIGKELSKFYDIEYVALKSSELKIDIPTSNFFHFQENSQRNISREVTKYFQYFKQRSYDYGAYKYLEVNYLVEYIKKNKIDIVIMNQGTAISLIDKIKPFLKDVKFVSWIHSSFDIYTNNYYRRFKKSLLNGITLSDCTICLTEEDRQMILPYTNKVRQIDNPNPLKNPKISKLDNKTIAFVSRLNFHTKGIDYLFDIAKNLPSNWKIRIAGSGNEEEKKKLTDIIKKKQLMDKIEYVGELSRNDLREFYYTSDMLISTSRWEGFGLSILEGMSAGLPIVSFNNRGPASILKNGEYGILVSDYDVSSMNLKIDDLIKNDHHLRKYQKLSLIRSNDFTSENITKKWVEVISCLT